MTRFTNLLPKEKELLINWFTDLQYGEENEDEAREFVNNQFEQGRFTVCRDYCSDGPGYVGDVIIGIFGEPEYILAWQYEVDEKNHLTYLVRIQIQE